jgi:DHA1 family bicyclomycin/chloramphenicol resistance-like MFS transporter
VAFIGTAQFTGWLTKRFGLQGVVKVAAMGYVLPLILLVVLFSLGVQRLDVLAILLFIGYGFLGLIIPTTSVLALDNHGEIAGTASALLGTLQMVTGAVVVAIMSVLMDGSALAMVSGITACALITWVLTFMTMRAHGHTAP